MITSGGNTAFTETVVSENNLKVALRWDADNLSVYVNGSEFLTSLSIVSDFASNTLNTLNFNTPSTYPFYGNINDIRVYNTALTDAELITLTT